MKIIAMHEFDPSHWERCYELYQRIYQESYPYRELPTRTKFLQNPAPFVTMTTSHSGFILADGDNWIACCHYKINPETKVITSEVKFIKSAFHPATADYMVAEILRIAHDHKLEVIQMVAENNHVRDYYTNRALFKKAGQVKESVLDINDLNNEQQKEWLHIHPTAVVKEIDWDDAALSQAAVDLHNEGMQDVPYQDAVDVNRHRERSYFLDIRKNLRDQGRDFLAYGLYDQDALIGLAIFEGKQENPLTFLIHYTGIARSHRRQNLAKRLKAETVVQLKQTFPSVRYIVTGNEETNAPMLRINNAMGFRVKSEYTMLRYLGRLG